ncbi:MAG: universal stress protein [Bacteroidales bacterium]
MDDKIIMLASYPYSRAILIKGRLESAGIECFLANINLVQPDISTGVKIMIREVDADKAWKIADEVKAEFGLAKQPTVNRLRKVRRILVPVDFSEHSVNACNFALGMAHKLKAEIKLLYVYFDPMISTESYLETYPHQFSLDIISGNLEKEAKEQMENLKTKIIENIKKEKFANIKVSYALEKGAPDSTILEYCKSYDPGVIILGTHGRDDRSGGFFGNVASKIIEKSTYPVFVIPNNSVFMGINYMNKVVYATDFDESDFRAIRMLMNLVRPFDIKIYCVHIVSDAQSHFNKSKMEKIRAYLKQEYSEFNIVCNLIEHSDIMQGLDDYIEDRDIDIIALTTHKRGMFDRIFNPSITRKMLFHTNIPLLVFHS